MYMSHYDARIQTVCIGVASFILSFLANICIESSFASVEGLFLKKKENKNFTPGREKLLSH